MAKQRANHQNRNPRGFRRNGRKSTPHNPLDDLVIEALDYINENTDNKRVYRCFEKKNGVLHTFGVYNAVTKKHSIHYVTNFYPQDLADIKMVVLDKNGL